MVTGAELVIASYDNDFYDSATPDMQFNAHMITSTWDMSTVTWNSRPSYESSTVLDYDYISKDDSVDWKRLDVTQAVKKWYEGDASNFGILLKAATESTDYDSYGVKGYLWPERYNDVEDAYPRIVISYRNTEGLESYYDYTSAGAYNGNVVHINTYNGNTVVTGNDLCAPGGKNPATLSRIYGSSAADDNTDGIRPYAGKGWRLNVQQTIRDSGLGEDYPYVYTDGDGTDHFFMKTDDGLKDEDGLGLTLEKTSSGYLLSTKTRSKYTFSSKGNLTTMSDEYGNDITVSYASDGVTISRIADASGYYIDLVCSDSGYLSSASDSMGNTVRYYYYSSGRIECVIGYNAERNAYYTYDCNGCINGIKSHDGSWLKLTYTDASTGCRASSLSEY